MGSSDNSSQLKHGRGLSSAGTEPTQQHPEPFVDADTAAEFLHVTRRRILDLARAGEIPAYPLGHGNRRVWRFRLSELACAMQARIHCVRQSPAPK
jgi:excisionase family DNA binding protein